jgi:ribonuclease BN (tRNA processing enzyme)
MACMRVTVIGCAGSFPGPDSPASCYLLEAEGFRLVMDMGNGALGVLQRHAELFGVDAVCLSHLHADHCVDLGSYWVARQYASEGPRPPIPVYGPRGTASRVAGFGGEDVALVLARFDFVDLAPGAFEIGPFRVTVDHMNHPVETFGFRLEHAGWNVTYSADTGESDALVRLAEGTDLLLCEASFLEGPDNPANLHLTARQAAGYAARAGVGQLVLTHLVPWNDQERTLAEAARTYQGPLSLATSGLVLGPGVPPSAGR